MKELIKDIIIGILLVAVLILLLNGGVKEIEVIEHKSLIDYEIERIQGDSIHNIDSAIYQLDW